MRNLHEVIYFVKKEADSTWKLENPVLGYCDLTFVLAGEAVYTSGNQTFRLAPGEAVFLPAGSDRYAQTNGMHCVAFNFLSDTPVFSCAAKISWHNDPVLNGYFHDFDQAWNTKSEIDRLRCDGLFLLILSRVLELQQAGQSNPRILRIKDYLHKHYTHPITVQQIAEQMQLNPVYCGALFSRECGETILHYANRLRIAKAKELLQYTDDPVSRIALDVGVEDLYYFSRMFKRMTGLSPQQFRTEQQRSK